MQNERKRYSQSLLNDSSVTKLEVDVVAQIDRQTGRAISRAAHGLCGNEEQLGILRDQLVQILNTLGIEPTADFARLNEIAIREIEAAQAKKAAL